MKTICLRLCTAMFLFCSILIHAQTQFNADPGSSLVNWKGSKPTGEHYGIVKVKNGFFTVNDKSIVSGEFEIDMNTITVKDIPSDEKSNQKLVRHLKSNDFFGVNNHPVATFKIISTESKGDKTNFTGNLTIKGITHQVSFDASIEYEGKMMLVKSEPFTIDRSKWDIKFKSKSFFENLGDKFIYDDMELSVEVTATK